MTNKNNETTLEEKKQKLIDRFAISKNEGFEGVFEDYLIQEIIDLEHTILDMGNVLEIDDCLENGMDTLKILEMSEKAKKDNPL